MQKPRPRRLVRRKRQPNKTLRRIVGGGLIAAVAFVLVAVFAPGLLNGIESRILPDRIALRAALQNPDVAYMRPAYAERGFKPVWVGGGRAKPEATRLVDALKTSSRDGLFPDAYRPDLIQAKLGALRGASRADRAKTELMLSAAYTRYISDLHTPSRGADLIYTDQDIQPGYRDRALILAAMARAKSPGKAFDEATRMNLLYSRLRSAYVAYIAGLERNAETEAVVRANLDRLRALPADLGDKFVLVDAASGRLWQYEKDKAVNTMKVVVGKHDQQTPQMVGVIRYTVFNPFWNVPPDLTRDNYAPRIEASRAALESLRMDAWSGFGQGSVRLDPAAVNWSAVSAGREVAWLRQRPGDRNSMGKAKFMLPNTLGIYLHDTPEKELFKQDVRTFSAGCVRVEDYRKLAKWLYSGDEVGAVGAAAEQKVDLPAPVPVYILYLTAFPENGAFSLQRDVYERDPGVLSALQSKGALAANTVSAPSA